MLMGMSRFSVILVLAILAAAGSAQAQQPAAVPPDAAVVTPPPPPPPPLPPPRSPVQFTTLAAPDAFSTPARDTGLPPTLWRGTSLEVVKAVLPLLAERPLSPAAQALARRVLATGAQGPEGAGQDPELSAGRAAALMGQGDPRAAAAILARAPGLDRSPELARVAAESALLTGQDARACQVEAGLTSGREDIYWVRLRTYCQAIGGQTAQAQLTFDLAQSQAKDAVFARLMAAKLAGVGNPGAGSLRNGLDYALSRNLGLDLSAANPSPAVAAALATGGPDEPAFDVSFLRPELAAFAQAIASGKDLRYGELMSGAGAIQAGDPKTHAVGGASVLLFVALADRMPPDIAAPVREGKGLVARDLALEDASHARLMGETALLALWACAEAGPAGLAVGERARIVHALHQAGLERDARAFALEGLLALK